VVVEELTERAASWCCGRAVSVGMMVEIVQVWQSDAWGDERKENVALTPSAA
jgi:hypothetical protein